MVRQEERESSPDARVVFDRASERFSTAAQGAPGSDPDFETAVVVCISVVTRLVRDGFSVDLVDATGVALCDPLPGGDEGALETMRLALADLRAQRQGALTAQGAGLTGDLRGPVVIVTGRPTAEDAAALAPAASHTTLPLLLAVGAAPGVLAAAQGWHASAVTATGAVPDAWAAVTGEGAEHARR